MTPPIIHSPLKHLRSVVPQRSLDFGEALRVAELQATKLHELVATPEGVQEFHLADMPRIRIVRERGIGVSGMSHWTGSCWLITLNADDPIARQRFTMLHEFKHVIDHGYSRTLYTGDRRLSAAEQAERAADYFAGCALVPKRHLKSKWGNGLQSAPALAAHFGVSEPAIRVRLSQTGLSAIADAEPAARCARPVSTPRAYRQRFYQPRRPSQRIRGIYA